MSWTLRPAGEADLPAVVAMERSLAELPHWSEAEYAGFVRLPDAGRRRRLLIAEEPGAGGLIGFAAMTGHLATGIAELESLAVRADRRRQGVALQLCQAVIAWSRDERMQTVELELRSRSLGALRLYEQAGFRIVGSRGGYYHDPTDDAVLMALGL